MKIPVLGMDPSLRNWGLAEATLDLETGYLSDPVLSLVQPKDLKGKQVRNNSNDLHLAEQLAAGIWPSIKRAKAIFVEVPVGSQSARAMASYAMCVGVLGAARAQGVQFVEVTATESKMVMTGLKEATKEQMIVAAREFYPNSNWPVHADGTAVAKAEHLADAIAAIHAGVLTPTFQNLLRLLQGV